MAYRWYSNSKSYHIFAIGCVIQSSNYKKPNSSPIMEHNFQKSKMAAKMATKICEIILKWHIGTSNFALFGAIGCVIQPSNYKEQSQVL